MSKIFIDDGDSEGVDLKPTNPEDTHLEDDTNVIKQVFKSKKREYRKTHEIVLELQPRVRWGKCVGASQQKLQSCVKPSSSRENYNISNQIWSLLANYVTPENLKSFALIGPQTAHLITSGFFWKQLYKRYCDCKIDSKTFNNCSVEKIRQHVIKTLFVCYQLFSDRIHNGIKLDVLRGKYFKNQIVRCYNKSWIICYEFHTHFPISRVLGCKVASSSYKDVENPPTRTVESWEDLIVDETNIRNNFNDSDHDCLLKVSIYSGANEVPQEERIYLLIIKSEIFDFRSSIFENYIDESKYWRLQFIKETLASNMRCTNLELSFSTAFGSQRNTIYHNNSVYYKVVPWYHPSFDSLYKAQCKIQDV